MSTFFLTTDHAASSYGQPVLVVNGLAYGPADMIPEPNGMSAADAVSECYGHMNPEQASLAEKFASMAGIKLRSDWPEPDVGNLLADVLK